jgi:hypothetical protein
MIRRYPRFSDFTIQNRHFPQRIQENTNCQLHTYSCHILLCHQRIKNVRRTGEAAVRDVREHPVQAVAELVEQRARIVEGQQAGLPRGGLVEVVVVHYDRQHLRHTPCEQAMAISAHHVISGVNVC